MHENRSSVMTPFQTETGLYLSHSGVVSITSKSWTRQVREGNLVSYGCSGNTLTRLIIGGKVSTPLTPILLDPLSETLPRCRPHIVLVLYSNDFGVGFENRQ